MLGTQHNRVLIHEFIRGFFVPLCFTLRFAHFSFVVRLEVFHHYFSTAFVSLLLHSKHQKIFSVQCISSATFHFQLEGWIFNFSQILSRGSPCTSAGNPITEIVWNR